MTNLLEADLQEIWHSDYFFVQCHGCGWFWRNCYWPGTSLSKIIGISRQAWCRPKTKHWVWTLQFPIRPDLALHIWQQYSSSYTSPPLPKDQCLFVINGGALLYRVQWESRSTFGEIVEKVCRVCDDKLSALWWLQWRSVNKGYDASKKIATFECTRNHRAREKSDSTQTWGFSVKSIK